MGGRAVSNYPPGVTGNEPEIAGYDEGVRHVECDEEATAVYAHEVKSLVSEAAFRLEIAARSASEGVLAESLPVVVERIARQMRSDVLALAEAEETVECGFVGEVDVVYGADRTAFAWDCPRCGYEHEEED